MVRAAVADAVTVVAAVALGASAELATGATEAGTLGWTAAVVGSTEVGAAEWDDVAVAVTVTPDSRAADDGCPVGPGRVSA